MPTKPTLDIFTGSKTLGTVFNEQNQITVKYFEANLPGTDTEGRIATNIFGKTRIIVIQGAHDGTGFGSAGDTQEEKLADFIYEMEEWVNHNGVNSSQQYTDSFGVSYTVDAIDWTWTRSFNQPFRILYTLLMKGA